jgi:hypothetical protein
MPLTYFKCEAGHVLVKDCLKHCPKERCLSLPTLQAVGEDRTYEPPYVFSTTQLLNGTRLAYLQIIKPYGADPKQRGFMLLGTRHHQRLEEVAKRVVGMIPEKQLGGEISGILDLLQPNGDDTWSIIDYKTVGGYAIKKMMNGDWSSGYYMQLNNYRVKAVQLGFNVTSLFIQYTARDGGTETYKRYGFKDQIGLISVPIKDDDFIISYFKEKDRALRIALETHTMPPMCSYSERWANKRCLSYCDLAQFCAEGTAMRGINA